MKRALLVAWFSAVLVSPAQQIPVAEAVQQLQADVASEVARLAETRAHIDQLRGEQRQRIDHLVRATAAQREQVATARASRAALLADRGSRSEQIRALRAELAEVEALLEEAARSFPTRLHPAEAASLPTLEGLEVLEKLAAWDDVRHGGHTLVAQVVDAEGYAFETPLTFLGPLAWAAGDRGPAPLTTTLNQALPTRVDAAVVGPGSWPLDPSGGSAALVQIHDTSRGWRARIVEGGPVMVPLLGVGLLALVLSLLKAVSLLRISPIPEDLLDRFAEALVSGDAAAVAEEAPSPSDELLAHAVEHRYADPAQLEELLHERLLALLPRLDRHLATLAVLAGVAPLLGLLGTVTGMIKTFQLITLFGSGDARMLSGGIAEALSTTAVGLTIAVPVLLLHALLSRKVRLIVADLEYSIGSLVHRLTPAEPEA